MEIIYEKAKKTVDKQKIAGGQIYRRKETFYMVTKSEFREEFGVLFNLTNLSDGNRWAKAMTLEDLAIEIENYSFKLVNVKHLIVREEV